MADPRQLESGLLAEQFRSFYAELVEWKWVLTHPEDGAEPISAAALSRQLQSTIELQTIEARRMGGRYEQENVQDARYLKAAIADEILVSLDWPGRETWTSHLLEASLFRTSVAGDAVFERIEETLRNRDPAKRELAQLYLFALSLGFEGKYRGMPPSDALAGYRRELFHFVYQREPDLTGQALAPSTYANTLSHVLPAKLPQLSRWTVIFGIVILMMLGVSQLLWLWQTFPLEQALYAPASSSTNTR
ncbi:MAG: DotU family type IV/VI secretion system protein [Burkholderiales bacterium]|nr:DotU family type IV/VI secretion system protein [Burkholderiales bacterium]